MSFPEQPFGFVAGRWVLSIGDTPDDADRAPDYVPVKDASVVFAPQVSHRVATDGSGWAGIIKDRVSARVGERGQLIDAEGHDHLALAVGVYVVSYDFGLDKSWPSHYIEVKTEHTAEAPLWLPPIAPAPEGPMIENRVVTIPADGEDGQVLVWDGGGFSWMDVPEGEQGPQGDIAQLAGAPRLTNLVHDTVWNTSNATVNSYTARTVEFTATSRYGQIRGDRIFAGKIYYFTGEVKATSDQVYFGAPTVPVYHSGSGDWERLTGSVTPTSDTYFHVRDDRSSDWDQIEVRDPVLIDLTEVFGAGREPTKEYMDALLAKHGHYIGGVDQFAVGDALHALTVAGQGMTLRYDTSVGERVFLDHPGGTTMLYGDTGWRARTRVSTTGDVTGEPLPTGIEAIPGATGRIALRRINNQIHFSITGLKVLGALEMRFPPPFRGSAPYQRVSVSSNGITGHAMLGGNDIYLTFNGTVDGVYGLRATFITDHPWNGPLPYTPL